MNDVVIFTIEEINKALLVLLIVIYYLIPGVLRYLYALYKKPENREKWYVYLFFSGNGRLRIGFAGALAFLTMEIIISLCRN